MGSFTESTVGFAMLSPIFHIVQYMQTFWCNTFSESLYIWSLQRTFIDFVDGNANALSTYYIDCILCYGR